MARCHVSKQYVSVNGRWLPLVSRCLRGLNCRILLQPEMKTQNRTSQRSNGSRRRPRSWKKFMDEVWPGLDKRQPSSAQVPARPLASALFTALPTSRVTRVDAQPFRLLLCRRLHLLLPLSMCTCRCELDMVGHHRAACAMAGVLGRRGYWNARQPKCAERLGHGCPRMFMSETRTSPTLTLSTAGDQKSWLTGFPCGMEPSWPSTTLVSPPQHRSARRRVGGHDGAARSCQAPEGAHVPRTRC